MRLLAAAVALFILAPAHAQTSPATDWSKPVTGVDAPPRANAPAITETRIDLILEAPVRNPLPSPPTVAGDPQATAQPPSADADTGTGNRHSPAEECETAAGRLALQGILLHCIDDSMLEDFQRQATNAYPDLMAEIELLAASFSDRLTSTPLPPPCEAPPVRSSTPPGPPAPCRP